ESPLTVIGAAHVDHNPQPEWSSDLPGWSAFAIVQSMRQAGTRAFSLLELLIVLVILGVISAIVIPRMSSAAERSSTTAVAASADQVQRAIDLFSTEHQDRSPALDATGVIDSSGQDLIYRL